MLKKVKSSGKQMWIVTGASKKNRIETIVKDFNEFFKIDKIVTGDDVKAGKPNPYPYILACAKANIHPHEAVVIENAPLGIKSADLSGAFCIGVNTGILDDDILYKAGARVLFENCEEIANKWSKIVRALSQ